MSTDNQNVANEVMCSCTGTTRGEIQNLFEQGFDLDGISNKRGVLSGCGGCEWDIETFLDKLAQQKKNN